MGKYRSSMNSFWKLLLISMLGPVLFLMLFIGHLPPLNLSNLRFYSIALVPFGVFVAYFATIEIVNRQNPMCNAVPIIDDGKIVLQRGKDKEVYPINELQEFGSLQMSISWRYRPAQGFYLIHKGKEVKVASPDSTKILEAITNSFGEEIVFDAVTGGRNSEQAYGMTIYKTVRTIVRRKEDAAELHKKSNL